MVVICTSCGYNLTRNTNLLIWWQRLTGKSPDNLEELREIAFDAEDENEDSASDLDDEETNTEDAENTAGVTETKDDAATDDSWK